MQMNDGIFGILQAISIALEIVEAIGSLSGKKARLISGLRIVRLVFSLLLLMA